MPDMNDLQSYIDRAEDSDKKARIKKQWASACNEQTITCCCGQLRALLMAYRCLYCGEWYCFSCAEKHFGQTIKEWVDKRRSR